ncbi:MAG: hypothetical protein U0U46_21685 [Saprospiraceae bacterium]
MTIVVTDTNIFLDLIQSGALDGFFQLPYDIRTTDLVLHEIEKPEQQRALEKFITSGRLTVLELDAREIGAALQLTTQATLGRITDRSVLLKGIQLQCIVLSGDRALRNECEHRGLEVHGSIWIFREIWQAGFYDEPQLLAMLDELAHNVRLPAQELDKLRNDIKNKA